jgi:LCP family protein required for cell wall assembly
MEEAQQEKLLILNRKTLTKGLLVGIIAYVGAMVFAFVFFLTMLFQKYQLFLLAANLSHQDFVSILKELDPKQFSQIKTTVLILGVDETENRPNFPQLTDSILLTQIDPTKNTITLLSLPRDLWSSPYQTKINALLEYGKIRYPEQPTKFPQEVIEEITNTNINYSLIISLDQLAEIIDLVGGVNVNVQEGFVDEMYPRDDVDITVEKDPEKLYETVEFKPGLQTMDGKTALKYIRSRHSSDLNAGNDLARSQRQQQVIQALIKNLSEPKKYWHQPQLAGFLLQFYQLNFNQYLPLKDILSIAVNFASDLDGLTLAPLSLNVYPDDNEGLIEHPKNLTPYQNQWVYIIRDEAALKEFVQQNFK